MRIKKGFTLAEILIVLTVIGVLATMTVPTMTKSMDEAQYKTAYKKAYSVVSNVFGVMKAEGLAPTSQGLQTLTDVYASLSSSLEKDGYSTEGVTSTKRVTTYNANEIAPTATAKWTNWIVSSDNIAYSVYSGTEGTTCQTKQNLNSGGASYNGTKLFSASCAVVAIDANGLNKTPNAFEAQMQSDLSNIKKLNGLTGDRFYIYIGKDGVAMGDPKSTFSGRILRDIKNIN